MTKPRPAGWRLLSSTPSEGPTWSSREDQARAARLDRELDAQNLVWAREGGPTSGGPVLGGSARAATGGPELTHSGELAAALAVAAELRILAEFSEDPPEEALVALRAATSALQARGPWRAMSPAARFGLSGVGAVAAAIIGAVAWAGLNSSTTPGVHEVNLVSVATKLDQAGSQISQATQALAQGDPVKAKQYLVAAQANTAEAAAQLQPAVQTAVGPRGQSPGSPNGNLSAELAQANATITSLQQTLTSLESTTTTSPAVLSTTSTLGAGGGATTPTSSACEPTTTTTTTVTTTSTTSTSSTTTTTTTTPSQSHLAAVTHSEVAPLVGTGNALSPTSTTDNVGPTSTSSTSSTTTTTVPSRCAGSTNSTTSPSSTPLG
jgi:hypothetical protein